MEQTENYQLSLWNKDDRILMERFNGDNAKIDAALQAEKTARETAVATLTAAVAKCGNCQIYFESYTGSGTANRTFTFPKKPLMILLIGLGYTLAAARGSGDCTSYGAGGSNERGTVSWGANNVKLTMNGPSYACNTSGSKYGLLALLDASA